MSGKTKVGIIGCGNISSIYLKNCPRFESIEISAVADLDLDRARTQAEKFGVPKALSVDALLADPEIGIVVNLTIPAAHAAVSLQVLRSGKSVYNEKPLALEPSEAREMLELAQAKGLRIGCAPDTFLGGGIQTSIKLLNDGAIGVPVAAVAFMLGGGHETWHPNPSFYYQKGGGPMFDMGPYYLTALAALLGPVRRVSGSARVSYEKRTISSEPFRGQSITVEVPTHIAGLMDFASGPVGTIITSFDLGGKHSLPHIEIYGSEGSLRVPDPNGFGGTVLLNKRGESEWKEIPLEFGYTENSRGVGVADMAAAITAGRPHRASGELASHVLDIMHAFHDSSAFGTHIDLKSEMTKPAPMLPGLAFGELPG